ncbi:hypothetical protein PENSPDRAFT_760083 [Peniophora sp. CONT]|nr:hypothetical protein PENSPDRAFT_760083 [Peniophora sp. CONT]
MTTTSTSLSIEDLDSTAARPATIRIRQAGQSSPGTLIDLTAIDQDPTPSALDTITKQVRRLTEFESGLAALMKLHSLPVPKDSDPGAMISEIGGLLKKLTSGQQQARAAFVEKDRAYEEIRLAHDKTCQELAESRSAHTMLQGKAKKQHKEYVHLQKTHEVDRSAILKERDDAHKLLRGVTEERNVAQGELRRTNATLDRVRKERKTARDDADRIRGERDQARGEADRIRGDREEARSVADRTRGERDQARSATDQLRKEAGGALQSMREERDRALSGLSSAHKLVVPLDAQLLDALRVVQDVGV